jgi:hypothetical protein
MATSTLTNLITASGYVRVTWTNAEQPANFYSWRLYYRSSTTSAWKRIYETKTATSSYTVNTYAWANKGTQEIVLVSVTQNPTTGALTESAYTGANSFTYSGLRKYWLVHPTDPAKTMMFNIATAEEFAPVIKSEVMNLLDENGQGGRRKVNVGASFGRDSSLSVTIYDDTVLGTATQQRENLEQLYKAGIELFLRDPFGGLSPVFVSGCSFKRIAGMGDTEGVEVQIDYMELDSGNLPA